MRLLFITEQQSQKTGHECIQALLLRLFELTTNGAFFDTVASL